MESTATTTSIKLALTLSDSTKVPLLLEMLRHFDFVTKAETEQVKAEALTSEESPVEVLFQETFGMWKDRNVDAQKLRNEAFARRTSNYDEQS